MKYDNNVAHAVETGLSKTPKELSSWLYYDEEGDKLFQEIMKMPEYYLTLCETEIFHTYKEKIAHRLTPADESFILVELGAGDGVKTEILLRYFLEQKKTFKYVPVDVSGAVLDQLTTRLSHALPGLTVYPEKKLYSEALRDMNNDGDKKKIIFFLGANIGNMNSQEAENFIRDLAKNLRRGDMLFIGIDLKKNPRHVISAYDDFERKSEQFNLNILTRINRQLDAHFDLNQFSYYPLYDPVMGTINSYLISRSKQSVAIDALNQSFTFDQWETIHTEVSQKYDLDSIHQLTAKTSLKIADIFYDSRKYFCNVVMTLSDNP